MATKDRRKPRKTRASGSFWQFSLWMWVWGREALNLVESTPSPNLGAVLVCAERGTSEHFRTARRHPQGRALAARLIRRRWARGQGFWGWS